MVRIEGAIVINRPVEDAFEFVADKRNEPRYSPQMRRAEQISDGPIGIGARFRAELVNMGLNRRDGHRVHWLRSTRRLASTTRCFRWTDPAPEERKEVRVPPIHFGFRDPPQAVAVHTQPALDRQWTDAIGELQLDERNERQLVVPDTVIRLRRSRTGRLSNDG